MAKTLRQRLCEKQALHDAWLQVKRGKKDEEPIKRFAGEDQGEENLRTLREELVLGNYRPAPLSRVSIDKAGDVTEKRILSVPPPRDRIVQVAIFNLIKESLRPHVATDISFCGVPSKKGDIRNSLKAVKSVCDAVDDGNVWVYESDIKKFFDRIPKRRLLNKLMKNLPDKSLESEFRRILHYRYRGQRWRRRNPFRGVPQGSPLSPLLSNFYLETFDRAIKNRAGACRVIRYADDYVILGKSREEVEKAGKASKRLLGRLGLRQKITKTKTISLRGERLCFLGLAFTQSRITAAKSPAEIKEKIEKEVLNEKFYTKGKYKGKKITDKTEIAEIMGKRLRGWALFLRPYHTTDLIKEVDKYVRGYLDPKRKSKRLSFYAENVTPILPLPRRKITPNTILMPNRDEWRGYFSKH